VRRWRSPARVPPVRSWTLITLVVLMGLIAALAVYLLVR
jgi:hypothetical protein